MESGHQVDIRNTAFFRHDYLDEHTDMRRLYEQAKLDQWNAATDNDWASSLEGDGGLIADDLVDIHSTKFWDRLSAASDAAEWVTGHALVVDGRDMTGTSWNPTSSMREELRALAEDKG